jgi:hypothetical protein
MPMMPWMRALHALALACLALTLTSCARLHARTEPISPPLEVPSPPPRVITATETAPLEATATVPSATTAADPPAAAVQPPADVGARRPPRTAAPVAATPDARADKPEGTTPPPPRPAAANNPPAPTLQTTTKVVEAEQKVRATIAQASRDLGRIEPKTLNAEAKAQFDIAKRFVEQAVEAVTAKNFVFAGQLADKAANLAALLVTR